jgi:phenylpropionate dioxygenase-like ring-hydroxylating dioxygenase large terminal subunit
MPENRIPAERYTSTAFAELEWERMWSRVWLLACPARDLEVAGAFVTVDFGRASVLLTRAGHRIRAFRNVCPHRGNLLCTESRGIASVFRCPFHGWVYSPEGRAVMIPRRESLDVGETGLHPLRCETACGFVWISFDDEVERLADFLDPLLPLLEAYEPGGQAIISDRTVAMTCNWKVMADAFSETYHVHATHPQLLATMDVRSAVHELLGRHSRSRIPIGRPAGDAGVPPALATMLRAWRIDPSLFETNPAAARPALQRAKRAAAEAAGVDTSRLSDEQITDDHQYSIFPNVTLNLHAEGFALFRYRPHTDDPARCQWDIQMFNRLPRGTGEPLRAPHEVVDAGGGTLGQILEQDLANLARVQRGLAAAGAMNLGLTSEDMRIAHFHKVLADYVGRQVQPDACNPK